MSEAIRFGLIGLGKISNAHIKAIKKTRGVELVAVCSRSKSKAEQKSGQLGIKGYSDYDTMLADSAIDAVLVLTPPHTHADLGIKAAKAGKHVLVEKPIDISLEKAKQLIQTCQDHNVQLGVISQMRFGKAIQKVQSMVKDGRFGDVFLLRASMKWSRNKQYYDTQEWKEKGGGVLLNQAIHFVDLIRWLGGDVESAHMSKETIKYDLPIEDTVVSVIKFKNKSVGIIEATTAACRNLANVLEVHGTHGSVIIRNNKVVESHFGDYSLLNTIKSRVGSKLLSLMPGRKGHFSDQLQNFADSIHNGSESLVGGQEAYDTLRLCEQMYKNTFGVN